jgi:hypothetical protein
MSRAISAPRPPASRVAPSESRVAFNYLERSELPLISRVFLLPPVILYEVGTRCFTTAALHGRDEQIIAFSLMQRFFVFVGAGGRHLPALTVIFVLLAWHIARKDSWEIDIRVLFGMAVESGLLTVPLILLGIALPRYFPLAGITGPRTDRIILALGAGVYEEFFFRLALFAILSLLLRDFLQVGRKMTGLLVVVTSAFLFSAYHYLSPTEHFQTQTFIFRTIAGAYFGIVFLMRGFGITASTHCFYDLIITVL